MNKDCLCGDADCRIELGKCHCGCGRDTPIAPRNEFRRGWVKGQPIIYIRGHGGHRRRDAHHLTEIDIQNRRAVCGRCGLVSIKVDKARRFGWRCTGRLNTTHRLVDLNPGARRAWCLGCLTEVDVIWRADRWMCESANYLRETDYKTRNKERILTQGAAYRKKGSHILRTYGLSIEEYESKLAKQNGVCAICFRPPKEGFSLCVDHCHDTGKIRGLLCSLCNNGIGRLRDDPEIVRSALDYLLRWEKA